MTGPPSKINLVNLGGKRGVFCFRSCKWNDRSSSDSGGLSVQCDHFDIQRAQSLKLEAGSQKSTKT